MLYLKSGNLIINWLLLSYATFYPETLSSQFGKIRRQRCFKNPNFQTCYWIGKHLEVQSKLFKIFHFFCFINWEKLESIHSPKPTLQNLILESMDELWKVENKMSYLHKKGWSHFKLYINYWDILFPKILRIYQWIGEKVFNWGKWNGPIENSAHTAECLVKRPWRYIFLTYVYGSIALVNELKRLKC